MKTFKRTSLTTMMLLVFCYVSGAAIFEGPALVINSPPDNYWTNISVITITGETQPGAALSLNETPIFNDNGTFSENVTLNEGPNTITVVAQKNGNISKATVNITLDTKSPDISIIAPEETYINSTSLNLSYTSNASDIELYRVRLNKGEWNISSKNYYLFNLTEGHDFIEVQAVDHAGNAREASLNLTVDSTPPVIEITKPAVNETINTRFIEMSGITESGANISVNGMNVGNDNGTWNISVTLSGVDNIFHLESIDKAGNIAGKTINIRIGENFSTTQPIFQDFYNTTTNFSRIGKFDGINDAVSGKYVSYLFDRNDSAFMGYSIKDSESITVWFNKISIKNFTAENINISGPVIQYTQAQVFGKSHYINVEIHDNRMGSMLIDVREFEDIYAKVREYLLNLPRQRLEINVSRDLNVTFKRNATGSRPQFFINDSWRAWPEVTFELANDVNATEIDNGYRFTKGNKEAYLFRANYAGGSSDFTLEENNLSAKVNYSLLLFRQLPIMGLQDEDMLNQLISQGISNGIIGAEIFIDDVGSYDAVAFRDLRISAGFPSVDAMELNVSSASPNGTVLAFAMSGKFFNNFLNKNLTILYDGKEIYPASNYQDIMDVNNDFGQAEYMLAMGKNGALVLISIPGFSSHIISFKSEPPPGTYGSMIYDMLNLLSGGLLMALPATSREVAFGLWWFVVVLMIYIVLRKAVRKKK